MVLQQSNNSDRCFRFFAVGERCDVSFKSVPVPAALLPHNLAQGANSRQREGFRREKTHTHTDAHARTHTDAHARMHSTKVKGLCG